MAGIGRIIAVALPVLAALGCGPRTDFNGTWKGRRDLKGSPGADPVIVGNLNRVELTLKPNGRFDLFDFGFPRSGTWTSSGDAANLTIDQNFDRRNANDMNSGLTLKSMGKDTAEFQSDAGKVILKRELQPGRS
jgi:hypothetical protein